MKSFSQSFFNKTMEMLPAVFYAKDLEGRFTYVNKAFCELFAWNESEIIGKDNHELFPKDFADAFRTNDLQIITSKRAIESEEQVPDAQGRKRIFRSLKFPYIDDQGEVYGTGGISLDITDEKALETQAYDTAKLASLGKLAAGIGHEINNPLTIINGNVEILKFKLAKKGILSEDLLIHFERYGNSVKRIISIVDGLRTFSRLDAQDWHLIQLPQLIRSTAQMVKDLYAVEKVKIHMDITSEDIKVLGNFGRIQQVLMNLISNSKDAIQDRPIKELAVRCYADGDWAIFTVADNGEGISPQIKSKIFESFFTTKTIGKGTGLGLSLSAAIIEEHKGKIDYTSNTDGTTFFVRLPRLPNATKSPDLNI